MIAFLIKKNLGKNQKIFGIKDDYTVYNRMHAQFQDFYLTSQVASIQS